MKRTSWLAILFSFCMALSLLAGAINLARAENLGPGGGTRIIVGDEIVGPYRLLVTVSPEPAQVGVVTYVVRVTDPASGENVRDADVTVELTHSGDQSTVTGVATHKNAGNLIDYAAHMQIDSPAVYNGRIRISGPLGRTEVTFVQRVLAPRRFSTVLMIGVPFVVVLGILAGIWYARSGQRSG